MSRRDLFAAVQRAAYSGLSYPETLNLARFAYIVGRLEKHGGNQVRAAKEMGIHRNTLSRQMAVLGVDAGQYRRRDD